MMSDEEQSRDTSPQKIEVSEDNPYYTSENGVLYTKDRKTLLFDALLEDYSVYYGTNNNDYDGRIYNVPKSVEVFEPLNGVACELDEIVFSKNIKEIKTFFDMGENGHEPNTEVHPDTIVKGYKGTAAESWAKEQYATFESLD